MSEDEWRQIPDFPNYEVTNAGLVRNKKTGRPIKWRITIDGYPAVNIRRPDHTPAVKVVHRLVLRTFGREPLPGEECRHLDGNPGTTSATCVGARIGRICWTGAPTERP